MRAEKAATVVTLLFLMLGTVWGQSVIPTPESVLGKKPGSDFFLASYDESLQYFRRLDDSSDRLQLVRVGQTSKGVEWYIALISSADNLSDLAKYKDISRRLALAEGLTDDEAHRLAAEGRAIVHIDGGLHATEVAHAQHTIQLAYDLVSARDNPEIEQILNEVILVLWFSINPDGQNEVVAWYRRNLGTPFEVSPFPGLYQKYVGHDNNRDGYMNNMIESQVVTRTTLEYSPQVFYNHHQTAPFPARIWIPPFAEPVSRNTHPLMWRWVNLFGTNMAAYLDQRGMPGAIHRGRGFDDWYPGFIDHVNSFRNTVSFLTETALYRYATPHFYTVNDFPNDRRDLRPEVLYPSPWRGGWWRLGDAVRYMIGASMSVLDLAAKFREDLLYNRYQAGRDVIRRFRSEPPYAYVIPVDQRDVPAAALLAEKIRLNGLKVGRAARPFPANGREYPAGSWVVPMDQPFAALAKELLEIQDYPDLREFPDGPPDLPYDVAGWTLWMQMGVEAVPVLTEIPESARQSLEWLDQVKPPSGSIKGSGAVFAFDHTSNIGFRVINQVLDAGGTVGVRTPEGKPSQVVIRGISQDALHSFLSAEGLTAQALPATPSDLVEIRKPKVGLYRPWAASIDEGWTRWILEQHGFSFQSVHNADMQSGPLRDRFDALIIPDISGSTIMEGYRTGTVPAEYEGGIGEVGLENLRDFVHAGGTLVTFNDSTLFAVEKLNIPVKNVLEGLKNQEFFCSGSILRIEVADPNNPVTWGAPSASIAMFDRGPAFEVKPSFKGKILASYPKDRNPLLSGFILHPEKIQGKGALVEAQLGQGRVILVGFRPQWRGQSHATYRFIFNSLYAATLPPQPEEEGKQSAQAQWQVWQNLRGEVRDDLERLLAGTQEFSQARGGEALKAGQRLDALIDGFRTRQIPRLAELREAVTDSNARDSLKEYESQLRSLLVDLRAKDLSAGDYGVAELALQYGLGPLEENITGLLRAAR